MLVEDLTRALDKRGEGATAGAHSALGRSLGWNVRVQIWTWGFSLRPSRTSVSRSVLIANDQKPSPN